MTAPVNPQQAQVDSDVASLNSAFTTLANLLTQIAALLAAAQKPNLNLADLDALLPTASALVTQAQALVPVPGN